mgnify:CR=1 FL=1
MDSPTSFNWSLSSSTANVGGNAPEFEYKIKEKGEKTFISINEFED